MTDDSSRVGVADAVWLAGCDGQWRTATSLAEEVPFRPDEVEAALNLLVRYGFAESCVVGEKWFRIIQDAPSPIDAVYALLSVSPALRTALGTLF